MPPRKRTSPARERWVPAGLGKGSRPAPDRSSGGSGKPEQDTDEWLVPDAARPAKKRTRSRPKRTGPKKARQAARPKPKEPKVDDPPAEQHARELEQVHEAHEMSLAELREDHQKELAELREGHERELAQLREQLATARKRTTGKRRSTKYPKSPKSSPPPAVDNGQRLDINTIEFDELRALGLSVSQSARLIATRDAREGFKSLKELDELPDLPSEVVSTLKQQLRV